MKELKTNEDLYRALGSIDEKVDGINNRLSTLNGSVAKHQDKFNDQAILNAQNTLIHQSILDKVMNLEKINQDKSIDEKNNRKSDWTYYRGVLVTIGLAIIGFILGKLHI